MKEFETKVEVSLDDLVGFAFSPEEYPNLREYFINSYGVDYGLHDKFLEDFGLNGVSDFVDSKIETEILKYVVGNVKIKEPEKYERDSENSIFVTMTADIDDESLKRLVEVAKDAEEKAKAAVDKMNEDKTDIDIDERE